MSHEVMVKSGGQDWGPFKIDLTTSFSLLKQVVLEQISHHESLAHCNLPTSFISFRIEYISLLHDLKVVVIPHEHSYIVSTVDRLQRNGLCSIYFHLVDQRRRYYSRTSPNTNQHHSAEISNSINYIPKTVSNDSMLNLTYLRWPLSATIPDSLFWTLSSMATIQGKLLRKMNGGKRQEIWREDWFMLIGDKIWAFPLVAMLMADKTDSKDLLCPTYISLGPNPQGLQVNLLDLNTFCISNSSYDTALSQESPLTTIAHKVKKKDIFKAKNTTEAQKWMLGIANFVQSSRSVFSTVEHENDLFSMLDDQIKEDEMIKSTDFYSKIPVMHAVNDLSNMHEASALTDVLNNSQLRDRFKRYLQSNQRNQLLVLWENCEDYRRGHPASLNPYEVLSHISLRWEGSRDHKSILSWFCKIYNLWESLKSTIIEGGQSNFSISFEEGPNAFNMVQQECWTILGCLAEEFVRTNEYWEVVFRLAGSTKIIFPHSEAVNRQLNQKEVPKNALTTLTSFMGFRRAEKPKLADTNSAMLNRSSKPSSVILEAVWRDGDYVSDMSSEWWKLISPMFVSSMVTASSMKSFFETSPLSSIQNIKEDGVSGVDYTINSITHGLGTVHLASTMRCFLALNSNAPKARPISLFIFGGDNDSASNERNVKSDSTKKSQWYEESFASLTAPGGQQQVVVLSTILGTNVLSFLDPPTLMLNFQIRLDHVSTIGPADKVVNAISINDRSQHGFCMQSTFDGGHELDPPMLTSRWLHHISMLQNFSRSVKIILKRGYLQKRGRLNTAFRWRWFELSSDLKLRYFKDDNGRAYKGVIDLSMLDASMEDQGVTRSDLEIVLNMRKISRKWVLKGENEKEAEEWILVMRAVFQLIEGGDQDDRAENNSDREDEDEEEEDEEEDVEE